MPDLQDLTNDLIETMSARRAAVTQAIKILEALGAFQTLGNGAPPKPKARRPKIAKPAPKPVAAKKPATRLPKASFLEAVTRTLKESGKPMRVVALRDALLRGPCKGRNPKALYNQICNSLAGKKQFKRTAEGVALA